MGRARVQGKKVFIRKTNLGRGGGKGTGGGSPLNTASQEVDGVNVSQAVECL